MVEEVGFVTLKVIQMNRPEKIMNIWTIVQLIKETKDINQEMKN
jgi:hypothetical protein